MKQGHYIFKQDETDYVAQQLTTAEEEVSMLCDIARARHPGAELHSINIMHIDIERKFVAWFDYEEIIPEGPVADLEAERIAYFVENLQIRHT